MDNLEDILCGFMLRFGTCTILVILLNWLGFN